MCKKIHPIIKGTIDQKGYRRNIKISYQTTCILINISNVEHNKLDFIKNVKDSSAAV